jgi:hypothetical protein
MEGFEIGITPVEDLAPESASPEVGAEHVIATVSSTNSCGSS